MVVLYCVHEFFKDVGLGTVVPSQNWNLGFMAGCHFLYLSFSAI